MRAHFPEQRLVIEPKIRLKNMKRSGGNKRENTRPFLFIFYPTILEPAFLLVSTSGGTSSDISSPIPNLLSFRLSFQLKDGGTRSLSVTFISVSLINGQFQCKMFLLIQCAAIKGKPRYISFRFLNSIGAPNEDIVQNHLT